MNPEAVAPAERGATRITDRVVAKVAAQAAREAGPCFTVANAPPCVAMSSSG